MIPVIIQEVDAQQNAGLHHPGSLSERVSQIELDSHLSPPVYELCGLEQDISHL